MKAEIEVLHIEDDRGFRNLLSDYFKQINRNITVESEQSVERGIDRLESASDIDCVVSDLELPGKSGLEFLEWVRETLSNLPFILYTGKGSEAVASEAVSKGATDYLQKDGGTEEFELLANRIQNSVQQYRSRREAEQTRRRLRTLAESTPHCVWMFDSDWEELLFVSGYEEVWGRPTAAIRENPQDFLDGVHPDDREFVEDLMRQMSAGEAIDAEYRIVRGDGETGWVWAQGEPTFTDDGAVKSVVGFTRDITERKQRERRLERQNERFDELASAISHDLQTPLQTARGRAEIAIETGDTEQMKKALDAINRTDSLRESLVDVLRTRQIVDETEPVEVGALIRKTMEFVDRHDDLSVQMMDPVEVEADPDALRQLFENLLSNAVEHGSGDATVRIGRLENGFFVEDGGPGIPDGVREEVFSLGYTTKDGSGGVGLASVRQITEAHGWDIRVTDSSEGGAKFELITTR